MYSTNQKHKKYQILCQDDMLCILVYLKTVAYMNAYGMSIQEALQSSENSIIDFSELDTDIQHNEQAFMHGHELEKIWKSFISPIIVDDSVPDKILSYKLLGMPEYAVGYIRVKAPVLDMFQHVGYQFCWFVHKDLEKDERRRCEIITSLYNMNTYTETMNIQIGQQDIFITRLTRFTYVCEIIVDGLVEDRMLGNNMELSEMLFKLELVNKNSIRREAISNNQKPKNDIGVDTDRDLLDN